MKVKATPSMIDPVRCRFCVEGQSFLQMVAHLDGRVICGRCGHVEIPNVECECNCGNCAEVKRFELSRTAGST
jgi:ribosomal protein S27AE